MTKMDESEIRRLFARLHQADRLNTPDFAQLHGRVRARRSSSATPRARPLAIAAAAVIALATVWLAHAPSFSLSTATPAIATWRAPTDVLLRPSGSELLRTVPALSASMLDRMIHIPSKRGT